MSKFTFIIENEAFEGVKRTAKKVASDFKKVCGKYPRFTSTVSLGENTFIFATLGKSPFVDTLINKGIYDSSPIIGKREVFSIKFIDNALLICGSDKRGTIYGMFALSEYIGVSPLHFWGDVEPVRRKNLKISKDIETVSKEPSVKYRGFFINDEWPCFGTWTFGHFKGFTAEMYDHVFELILRLKGNYLWPAMWTSSFALDGPGNLNEELADIYGILAGGSHHEPCLRASEEWDKVRGQNSIYGNEWNYYKNKNGLLKYWEDALIRSGKYEKIITIGMRGERDSSMLGDDSPLKDNIDLLKDIIKNQRELIKKHINQNIDKVPQVIALYKEVEEYFYGKEGIEGLKDWDGLDGVICMLCEDNFGFMRTLPTEEIRSRKGGFGMYYHFDYHGGPVSYEWVTSASFERTWEQMCMAYDYGVRDIWIVNAGDLKFNEVPLNYFMELAYDFEKWGTSSPNSIDEYTSLWLNKIFTNTKKETREKMADVLHGYIRMNSARRPEALNSDIYHPCHYLEADRMLALAEKIDLLNEEIYSSLDKNEKNAYYSMIYFPAKASVNLLKMHLYAGKNKHYAEQGKKLANKYAGLVAECIEKDRSLKNEFARFKNGKWAGMELEQHIGFTKWNEDNCRYPVRIQVEPAYKPRMVVSRKDREEIFTKTYGSPMTVKVDDFLYAGNDEVILEIANDGTGSLDYTIEAGKEYSWLEISPLKGTVDFQEEIIIKCKRDRLDKQQTEETAKFFIQDKETRIAVEVKAKVINAGLPVMTFMENNGVIVINANHFCNKKDVSKGGFIELKNYGRTGCGMKVFPVIADFAENEEKPSLTYRFLIEKSGGYTVELWTAPSNSVQNKHPLKCLLESSHGEKQIVIIVPEDFRAGNPSDARWCQGVLDNIRVSKASFNFEEGVQEITVSALTAGLVPERILIYMNDNPPLNSYLGPPESFCFKPS
ncbi:MAG: glycosyl hydrolase 115 family protein [Treponema sp.]|nr:glycosyl hydrolase 115 family protein [Treponema sp.]